MLPASLKLSLDKAVKDKAVPDHSVWSQIAFCHEPRRLLLRAWDLHLSVQLDVVLRIHGTQINLAHHYICGSRTQGATKGWRHPIDMKILHPAICRMYRGSTSTTSNNQVSCISIYSVQKTTRCKTISSCSQSSQKRVTPLGVLYENVF